MPVLLLWLFSITFLSVFKTIFTINEMQEVNSMIINHFYLSSIFQSYRVFEVNRYHYEEPSCLIFKFKNNGICYQQVIDFKNLYTHNKSTKSWLKLYSPGCNLLIAFYEFHNFLEIKRFHKLPIGFWSFETLCDMPTPTRPLDVWWIDRSNFFNDEYAQNDFVSYLSEEDKNMIKKIFFKKKIELLLSSVSVFIPIIYLIKI